MPQPPNRPVPGLPTRHIPWSAPPPRAATRSHPGTEKSDPPPSDTKSRPPESTRHKVSNAPQWAIGAAAVITALGGSKVLDALTSKPTVTPEQIVTVAKESRERDEKILAYLQGQAEDQAVRDAVTLGVLCTINGGPPARGLTCPINACEARALTPEGKIVAGQPACRSVEEWPKTRRPP